MVEYVCDQCGARNAVGTTFCVSCQAYLAWEGVTEQSSPVGLAAPPRLDAMAGPSTQVRVPADATHLGPRPGAGVALPGGPRTSDGPASALSPAGPPSVPDRFWVAAEQGVVTVPPRGDGTTLRLHVANTSPIVDGYLVESPNAPRWLGVSAAELELYPGADGQLPVTLQVNSPTLVAAQQVRLVLRLRTASEAAAYSDVPVLVIVPGLDIPVRLTPEPRLLRIRDRDTAEFGLTVDNSAGNQPVRLQFAGSDPELAVQFLFSPPVLDVAPASTGSVRVQVRAPGPEAGQDIARALTIRAIGGDTAGPGTASQSAVETVVTLHQGTSAKVESPFVRLEIEPALVKLRDATTATVRILADNRNGTEWAHLQLRATDPERVVRSAWATTQLHVPAGQVGHTEARFEAPLPDLGTEVTRMVTVTAGDGRRSAEAQLTIVQAASASPMSTLAVRLEPSVLRVTDADTATMQVVLDNRRSRAGLRIFLEGSEPEHAVRFTFRPPVIDLGPGEVRSVPVQLDTWRPAPGQELTRQLTVTASDGRSNVDAAGTWVHAAARDAFEQLGVRVEPSVLRLGGRRTGHLTVALDNRTGTRPVRVSLAGDDPERSLRFVFGASNLEVPPGQVAQVQVDLTAPRAPAGRETTRPYRIVASDGRKDIPAPASLIQSGADHRPAVRVWLTLLGALAMLIGSFGIWLADGSTGLGITAGEVVRRFGGRLALMMDLQDRISAGMLIWLAAAVALFGLTGKSGRLTRWISFLTLVGMVAGFVALAVTGRASLPQLGALLVMAGCVLAYIGGLVGRR